MYVCFQEIGSLLLEFYDEIECDDLFEGADPRERILIFQLPGYGTWHHT